MKISELARGAAVKERADTISDAGAKIGTFTQSAINEACKPLVKALRQWYVNDAEGYYPDHNSKNCRTTKRKSGFG